MLVDGGQKEQRFARGENVLDGEIEVAGSLVSIWNVTARLSTSARPSRGSIGTHVVCLLVFRLQFCIHERQSAPKAVLCRVMRVVTGM